MKVTPVQVPHLSSEPLTVPMVGALLQRITLGGLVSQAPHSGWAPDFWKSSKPRPVPGTPQKSVEPLPGSAVQSLPQVLPTWRHVVTQPPYPRCDRPTARLLSPP